MEKLEPNFMVLFCSRVYKRISIVLNKIFDQIRAWLALPTNIPVDNLIFQKIFENSERGILKVAYIFIECLLFLLFINKSCSSVYTEKSLISLIMIYFCSKMVYFMKSPNLKLEKIVSIFEGIIISIILLHFIPCFGKYLIILNTFMQFGCIFIFQKPYICLGFSVYCSIINSAIINDTVFSFEFVKIAGLFLFLYAFAITGISIYRFNNTNAMNLLYTEILKLQESIQNNTMFVASVSHDLKNPLNAILNSISCLNSSQTLTLFEKKSLQTAIYSGQIMQFLIGNILDATRIGTGKFDLNLAPFSICDETRKVIRIQKILAKQKNVSIYKRVFSPIPHAVIGDSMRLVQILINLIGNAIKFTSKGYVAVLVKWAKNSEEAHEDFLNKMFGNKFIESPYMGLLIPPEEYFIIGSQSSHSSAKNTCRKSSSIFPRKITSRFENPSLANEPLSIEVANEQSIGILSPAVGPLKSSQIPENSPSFANGRAYLPGANPPQIPPFGLIPRHLSRSHPIILTSSDQIIPVDTVQHMQPTSSMCCVPEGGSSIDSESSFAQSENEFEDEKGYLVYNVIDTGIGMTSEELSKLFHPFSQAHEGIKKAYGGTGLGLWIAKQLIELMNGEITVKSAKTRGTVFSVIIPFIICKSIELPSPQESKEEKKMPQSSLLKKPIVQMESKERISLISREMSALRLRGKTKFIRYPESTRKTSKVLVLENRRFEDDLKLEQIVRQLKKQNCIFTYSTYDSGIGKLQQEHYDFNAIIIIASVQIQATKAMYSKTRIAIENTTDKKIKLIIACELNVQAEYVEIAGISVITFPIKQDNLANMVYRSGQDIDVTYDQFEQAVEEIKQKSRASGLSYDVPPEKPLVLIADDDVFSNLAVKTMIEKEGKYQAISAFDGREVFF